MKKQKRFQFWLIIILTILAIVIDIPPFTLDFTTSKIPFIEKSFHVKRKLGSDSLNIALGPLKIMRDISFRRGLDLAGGSSITFRADMKGIESAQRDTALEGVKDVIERRINLFGVREPIVQTAKGNGDYRIIVELPEVTDTQQARQLIGTTAELSFWEEGASESGKIATSSGLPLGLTYVVGENPKKTNLTGNDLDEALVTFDQNKGEPQVQLTFSEDGAKKFAEITKRNVGKIVAIVLDNQVIQAPRVNEPILTGSAVITGGFTVEQAKQVSIQLNAGALPVPLIILEQKTIGATLGTESLTKSLLAGIIGFLTIVVFMVVLYGRLGLIASLALILYALFTLALFKLIPITITLAGIAGFILSIGMAVDANILIFERMKEEKLRGKPDQVAMELGFSRAWTSIRDSNVSTIITSIILFYFGTGTVRGFAVTLFIGVMVSMFSAITVTRTILRMVYRKI